jgi:hypothetical protein
MIQILEAVMVFSCMVALMHVKAAGRYRRLCIMGT